MPESLTIRTLPDGSLCLWQGAFLERGLWLLFGLAALIFCFLLAYQGSPLSVLDAFAFATMFGCFFGALAVSSSEIQLNKYAKTLSYKREQWGIQREFRCRFEDIESWRRTDGYETGKAGKKARFYLRVQGRELPLLSGGLSMYGAASLEMELHALLPHCAPRLVPMDAPDKETKGEDELFSLSHPFDRALQILPDGTVRVQSRANFERFSAVIVGVASFTYALIGYNGTNGVGAGLMAFAGIAFVASSLSYCSFEWIFDPNRRELTLIEQKGGMGRRRVFGFDDVRAVQCESFRTSLSDEPRERFRLFLQIGKANERLQLSPKDLTRVQADELERAVRDVLTSVSLNMPLMESKRERR